MKFYEVPTQVAFIDFDSEDVHLIGGIAFQNHIICGCCGGILDIDELYLDWEAQKNLPMYQKVSKPIFDFDNWIDLSEEIKGYTDLEELIAENY